MHIPHYSSQMRLIFSCFFNKLRIRGERDLRCIIPYSVEVLLFICRSASYDVKNCAKIYTSTYCQLFTLGLEVDHNHCSVSISF